MIGLSYSLPEVVEIISKSLDHKRRNGGIMGYHPFSIPVYGSLFSLEEQLGHIKLPDGINFLTTKGQKVHERYEGGRLVERFIVIQNS